MALLDPIGQEKKFKAYLASQWSTNAMGVAGAGIVVSLLLGFVGGVAALYVAPNYLGFLGEPPFVRTPAQETEQAYQPTTTTEELVIAIARTQTDSVVAVVATKDLPQFERCFISPFPGIQIPNLCETGTTQNQEIGAGSGFVAAENLVVTNKHVVADPGAEYVVVTHDNRRLAAEVLARDPVEDLAILRVEELGIEPLPLGDSDVISVGQMAVAVGNALGEFENSFSLGIISGLSRTITATGGAGTESEVLRKVIQTDAAINPGNSGGPLFNLRGEVIGVNVARAQGADNVGFAVPINRIKRSLEQATTTGEVVFPFLGVRFIIINEEIQDTGELPVSYGALVQQGDYGEEAVASGSPADKAGIVAGDIILEVQGERVTEDNPLGDIINRYAVGDSVSLLLLRDEQEIAMSVQLEERP
jgi:serine protease Do